jgi:hypothetical protein
MRDLRANHENNEHDEYLFQAALADIVRLGGSGAIKAEWSDVRPLLAHGGHAVR